jgi:prepilin-type N-terminal cleavage/methylation domain-containing protein
VQLKQGGHKATMTEQHINGITRKHHQRGFSLIEMLIVATIIIIIAAFASLTLATGFADNHTRQALDTALTQMRVARERAVSERKQYILCFGIAAPLGAATPLGAPTTQSIQLFRWDQGTALAAAVQITNVSLPTDIFFQTIAGIPTAATPDGFGVGVVALDLDQGVAGGNKQQIMFLPDGTARDTNLNLNSGVIYMAKNATLYSSRAISLFGASGRSRGWALVKQGLGTAWVQQ